MTGTADSAAAPPRAGATMLLLAALCVPLFLVATGTYDLDMKGEPREGITAWETIHGGNWLLPVLNGERLPEKPIMFPWLVALSMRALGETSEWAMRVPSALLATGLVLVTFGIGRRLLGQRAGTVAALATASTFLVISLARRSRVDMALSFFACFALLQFVAEFQRDEADPASRPSPWRLLGFWLAVTFATLTKGPLGGILVGLPAGSFLAARRRLGFLKKLFAWWGVLLYLGVAGSWYAYGLASRGGAFGFRTFLMENILMFLGSEGGGGHRHGFVYLVPYYFFFGLPWCLFLPSAALLVVRRARGAWAREPLLLPLLWFGTLMLFFSIASGKRSDYLLPLLPAASLLFAGAWDAAPRSGDALARRAFTASAWLLAALGVLLVAVLVAAARLPADAFPEPFGGVRAKDTTRVILETAAGSPWATAFVLAAILVAAAAPAVSISMRRPERGVPVTAVATALAIATAVTTFLPSYAACDSLKAFTADLLRIVPPGTTLRNWHAYEEQVLFYSRRHVPSITQHDASITDHEALVAFLAEPGDAYVLTTRENYDALGPAAKPRFEIVLESHRLDRRPDEQSLLLRRVPAR